MKMFKTIAASALMAAAMMGAGAASAATIYNLNTYSNTSGITGSSLGTVTVGGQGTNVLSFDVLLNSNVFFQMTGKTGQFKDAFWFDLLNGSSSFTGPVTFNITSPTSGLYGTGNTGQFQGETNLNSIGQGWNSGYDYGVQVEDTLKPIDYYTGHLTFTVTGAAGTQLDLAPEIKSVNNQNSTVYGGADLRQCPGTDPTSGTCLTGPVGFSLTSAVPEPATWAIMLMGFGGLGAMLRQRRQQAAAVRA